MKDDKSRVLPLLMDPRQPDENNRAYAYRILRKIASGDNLERLGDTTTLAHPEVLEDIYNNYLKLKVGQPEK